MIDRLKRRILGKGGLRKELAQGALGSMVLKVLFTGITFVNVVLLARLLGPEGYGVFSYVLALVNLLTIPSQIGIPTLATREMASAKALQRWGIMRGLVRRAHQAIALMTALLVLLASVVLYFIRDDISPEKLETMVWGLLLVPMVSLAGLRNGMLKGLRKVLLGLLPERLIRPGLVLVALLVVFWAIPDMRLSAAQAMIIQVVATAIAFLTGAWLFWRVRPEEMRTVEPQYQTRLWMLSVIPLGLVGALRTANGQIDILLLGIFSTDAEVGLYRTSDQIASLVLFGYQIVNSVLGPYFAQLHATGDRQRLQRLVTASSRVVLALTLPIVLLLIILGRPVITEIFGQEFEAAYWPLVILSLGQLLNASMGSVGLLLSMTGHERDMVLGIGVAVSVNIVFNLILIPLYGMHGAAVATVLTLATWNLMLRKKVFMRLGIETSALVGMGKRVGK